MSNDELSSNQKLKMMGFVDYVNSGNDLRYKYIAMLQRQYKDLLNEQKQEIICEYCTDKQTVVIGKAYGPHIKKYHPETVKKKRNSNREYD